MISSRWRLPLVIWILALLAWSAALLELPTIIRAPAVFLYVVVGTGMGWIRLLNVARGLAEWSLMIVLSLSLAAIGAIGMLYAGVWSPPVWLTCLVLFGVVGGVLVAWRTPTEVL